MTEEVNFVMSLNYVLGLSSHSVTGVSAPNGESSAIVVGRLGGLRTQRCHSALLRIDGESRCLFRETHRIQTEIGFSENLRYGRNCKKRNVY